MTPKVLVFLLSCVTICSSLKAPLGKRKVQVERIGNLDRRMFLRNYLIISQAPLLLSGGSATEAAVPTYDDYVDPGNSKKQVGKGSEANGGLSPTSFIPSKASADDLALVLEEIETVLATIPPMIDKQDWTSVLRALRSPTVANVLLKNEGRGSAVAETPKAVLILGVEDEWDEAVGAIGELKDFAFENQVVFFNSEDRSQIEKLASDTAYASKVDLSEPRRALEETRLRVSRIRAAASSKKK